MRYEVVIIGGGPAGLAAAIALRQRGIECAVFDGVEPPIDKACGEGLLPNALDALNQLGISIPSSDGYTLTGIDFRNAHCAAQAKFSGQHAIGVRRVRLHCLLTARANSLDIPLFWGNAATLGAGSTIQHDGETIHYRWLVIADGQTSPLRKHLALDKATHMRLRYASRQHFNIAPWSRQIEVHWGPRGQIYITPVAENEVCVALLTSVRGLTVSSALADFPALQHRLTGAPSSSRSRGAITATRMLRRVHTRDAALIGDASGSCDAITGEGLAASFRQALALANAIAAGDLAIYQHEHRTLAKLPHRMASLLLAMDRFPALERRALSVFSANPHLFGKFLDVHLGNAPFSHFALRNGASFAMRLLLPDMKRLQSSHLR
jgi:flavin-dependent dehydrogenase